MDDILNHSDDDQPSKRTKPGKQAPNDRQLAGPDSPQEDRTQHEDSICSECKQVDWASLPTLAADGLPGNGLTLRSMEATSEQLSSSSCKICRVLAITLPKTHRKGQVLKATTLDDYCYSVRDTSSRYITVVSTFKNDSSFRQDGSRCLAVVKRRDIDDNLESLKVPPTTIDYESFKQMIRFCEENHKFSCMARLFNNPPGIRVINVSSRTITEAPPQCKYLALSYVWGRQTNDNATDDLEHPPPVIEDAILVTKSMGYNYLWVDKYVSFQPATTSRLRYYSIHLDLIRHTVHITDQP